MNTFVFFDAVVHPCCIFFQMSSMSLGDVRNELMRFVIKNQTPKIIQICMGLICVDPAIGFSKLIVSSVALLELIWVKLKEKNQRQTQFLFILYLNHTLHHGRINYVI